MLHLMDRILVVGGAGGIGAGIAEAYGDRAVVWSRRSGVDATDPRQVRDAADRFLDAHGAPWALVHAVGGRRGTATVDTKCVTSAMST